MNETSNCLASYSDTKRPISSSAPNGPLGLFENLGSENALSGGHSNASAQRGAEIELFLRLESETQRCSSKRRQHDDISPEAAVDRATFPFSTPIDYAEPFAHQLSSQTDFAHTVFLFVNPSSGGSAAASFMEAGLEYIRLTCPKPINLWIFDIRQGSTGEKPGFIKLRRIVNALKAQQNEAPFSPSHNRGIINVIVAGGDGTVMWTIMELWAHDVDDNMVAIGVVPYGTGNDFARVLGWQCFNSVKPYEQKFRILKRLIHEWLDAQVVWHDIWEVTVCIKEHGVFQKIDAATRAKKIISGVPLNSNNGVNFIRPSVNGSMLTLKMCNYFSLGVESRIGIGFERHRTGNQFRNKVRYSIEGTKKACFKRTARVDQVLSQLVEISEEQINTMPKVIFQTLQNLPQLLPSASIIAINIPSFASGLDIWNSSRKSSLLDSSSKKEHANALLRSPQRLGDGLLEFVSFKNITEMGLERAIKGYGRRVHQGKGPFVFEFREISPTTRVYFQVDGEFFIMTCPKSILIRRKRRIKVLARSNFRSSSFLSASHNCQGFQV